MKMVIDRAVVEQALEALEQSETTVPYKGFGMARRDAERKHQVAIAALRADLSRCPKCNGPADNGFDRSFPPSPYLCTKCMAEPVEPVAWLQPKTVDAHTRPDLGYETCSKTDYGAFPVYTAPPQRKPLTEEEILKATGHCGVSKYTAVNITRAIERAIWEKNK